MALFLQREKGTRCRVYLVEGDSALPMSPDAGRVDVLEHRRERTTGAVWTRAALTRQCRHVSPCRNIQMLFNHTRGQGSDYNTYTNMVGYLWNLTPAEAELFLVES